MTKRSVAQGWPGTGRWAVSGGRRREQDGSVVADALPPGALQDPGQLRGLPRTLTGQAVKVRLAVGEACSRAVGLHLGSGVTTPVRVVLNDEEKLFSIEVVDEVAGPSGAASGAGPGPDQDAEEEDEMGLAVIRGLVDDVEVTTGDSGGVIRMSWPVAGAPELS